MKFFIITAVLIILPVTEGSSDISLLKTQIQGLVKQLSQTNQKLSQADQKIHQLETKEQTRNGYCQMRSGSCGSCFCVEDYTMTEKFYCDCRNKPIRRDCKEHHQNGERTNGLYRINKNVAAITVQVYCDQTTDGGGWTVVQRRTDGSENFYRNWTEYKHGFGKLNKEHWLGNENLYLLSAQAFLKRSEVRLDLIPKNGGILWAKYSNFEITSEATGYEMHISGYSGTAGDRMNYHNGMKFSTYEKDLDKSPGTNCAVQNHGAWWYNDCNVNVNVNNVNLNGVYDEFSQQKLGWNGFWWYPYRIKFSEMKLRRK